MKFRIIEEQFENKSEFYSEWFCDNINACNYGWNPVHDAQLLTTPTKTYEDELKRIVWFSNCFKKPIVKITHFDVENNFNINAKIPILKKIKFPLFTIKNQRELLLNFLYWRESEIHPADANKIVDNFLCQKKNN